MITLLLGFMIVMVNNEYKSIINNIYCSKVDTGHQFELYNNLNDDWEVVEADDDINIDALDFPF